MMDIDKSSYPVTVLKVTSVTGEEFNVLNDNDGMLYLNRTEYMTLIIIIAEQSYETKSPPTEHSLSDVMKQAKAAVSYTNHFNTATLTKLLFSSQRMTFLTLKE